MLPDKPWQPEPALRLLIGLFVCFIVGAVSVMSLRHLFGNAVVEGWLLNVIFASLCFQGAGLVLTYYFLQAHKMSWAEAFGFKNQPGWAVMLGICGAIIVLPACWWLQARSFEFFNYLGFEPTEQDAIRLLREANTWWKQAYLGVFAIVLAPVGEEVLFRGIAYPFIKHLGWPKLGLWFTATMFALIHGNIAAFLALLLLAVALTLLYEWTGNLLSCIVVHSLFNAANFGMLFILKNTGQLPASP